MTTNQLTTCSSSTLPPGRILQLAAIVPLLCAMPCVAGFATRRRAAS